MKRLTLSIAAMLCCFLGFSQGAEGEGNTYLFIPRIDLNPYVALNSDGYSGFELSNTSLYSLFEGNFGESDFSFSVEGHWLSTDPSSLYRNTFHSDNLNWLDWANITYAPSNLYFTLGKQMMSIGSFEEDAYDYDQHWNLCSTYWNNLQVYHWGATAGWCSDDESTDLSVQVTTSPYGEKFFKSNLYQYALQLRGEYGIWSTITSANAIGYDKSAYVGMFATGNKLSLGDFEIGADIVFRGYDFDFTESSYVFTGSWMPSDSFTLTVKGGIEASNGVEDVFGWDPIDYLEDPYDYYVPASLVRVKQALGKNYCFGGLIAEYYPLDNLRLHTAITANNWAKSVSVNLGAIYYFDLARFRK